LLGLTEGEINTGLAALQAAGIPFEEMQRTSFNGRVWGYSAVLIRLTPARRELGPRLFEVPLTPLQAANSGKARPNAGGLVLDTAAQQWAYSLMGPVRPEHDATEGAAVVRVRLQVEDGTVGVSVSSVGNISQLIQEVWLGAAPEETQEVDLDLPDLR